MTSSDVGAVEGPCVGLGRRERGGGWGGDGEEREGKRGTLTLQMPAVVQLFDVAE